MRVGVGRYVLHIPHARTLKDRRQVVKSFKDRIRAMKQVSIAEIGDANRIQVATFGVAAVSGEASVCEAALNQITEMARSLSDATLADVTTEILSFGEDGRGIATSGGERGSRLGFEPEPVRRPARSGR